MFNQPGLVNANRCYVKIKVTNLKSLQDVYMKGINA